MGRQIDVALQEVGHISRGGQTDIEAMAGELTRGRIVKGKHGQCTGDCVRCHFDLARHPGFIGLHNHENAQGAPHLRSSSAIRDTKSPLIEMIIRILA